MKHSKITILSGAALVASLIVAGNAFAGGSGGCIYSGDMTAANKAQPLVPADTDAEEMDPKWLLLLQEAANGETASPEPVIHN